MQLELKLIPPESLCSLELLPLHNLGENLAIFMLSSFLWISCTLMHRYAEVVKKAQTQNDDVVLQGEGRLYSHFMNTLGLQCQPSENHCSYLIIVADAADAVSVNFSGRCKSLQI